MEFAQNLITENKKPLLRTYLNITRFFNDYYSYRRNKDASFSYELWSEELGFKSKASARMVCQGRRNISEAFLNAFVKAENSSTEDQDYLQLLNFYQKAKSDSLKKCLLEKIVEKFDLTNSQKNVKNYIQFLSSTHVPVLQLLISFEDFRATEKNLKDVLGLDVKDLRSYLSLLEELELVRSITLPDSGEKVWISQNKLFKIPGEISDPALALFHEQTMQEAQEKLRSISRYNQFRTLYFSLNEEAFEDIYETLNDVANRLKVKYCNNFISDKKLFKFNFQLYPVTETVHAHTAQLEKEAL